MDRRQHWRCGCRNLFLALAGVHEPSTLLDRSRDSFVADHTVGSCGFEVMASSTQRMEVDSCGDDSNHCCRRSALLLAQLQPFYRQAILLSNFRRHRPLKKRPGDVAFDGSRWSIAGQYGELLPVTGCPRL